MALEFPRDLDARLAHLTETRAALLREINWVAPGFSPRALGARGADVQCTLTTAAGRESGAAHEWSLAEIVYHLHLSEKSIAKLLRKRLASADRSESASDEQLRTEWERVARLVGIRTPKVKAPALAEPLQAPALTEGIELLGQSRKALLEVVQSGSYADLLRVSAPHPFEAIGTLTGASWLSVVAFHEHRHGEQIHHFGFSET